MTEYIVAFVTGLTTGGLSCLAVQGGLLASSLASQLESDMKIKSKAPNKPKVAQPIIWFLLSKLIAYTLLGFFLGWLGSVLQLNPVSRAILQIGIGIFMIGQAMRLLNVHPIFRYFNIEPPKSVTRYIRKKSKNGSQMLTPIFLGALTVLIPCGITQVMMATAIATGNPIAGAALMFSFILGTSPIFFVVAYFATRLGEKLEKFFMKFVGVVVLILGLIGVNSGLNLIGSPLSFNNLVNMVSGSSNVQAAVVQSVTVNETDNGSCKLGLSQNSASVPCPELDSLPAVENGQGNLDASDQGNQAGNNASNEIQEITIKVENRGYSPEVSHAKSGVPVKLTLVSQDVYSCSLAFVIPSLNEQIMLDPTGTHTIDIPAQAANSKLPYSCSMGMYTGVIIFDL